MKVKNVLIQATLEGNGVVNMDSNDQKWVFNGVENQKRMSDRHNNTSYSKKNFYKVDGGLEYKLKISSDCLKNAMFKKDVIAQSPNISHHDAILYSYIASPVSILRGYLFADKKETLKRKGAITLVDAEQTCNAASFLETFSKSGERTINDGETDKADNTFYRKETVGEIHYKTMGNIDLMALQFVSCDQAFDRYNFNPDKFDLYKMFMSKRIPNFNSELAYYQQNGCSIDIPEYGVMLSNENVVFLVKELLKRLLATSVQRKGAYARVDSLKIKLVSDIFKDTHNNEDGWIEISSEQDIDGLKFEVEQFYELVDPQEVKEKREAIDASIQKSKDLDKKAAADKAKQNKKNKNQESSDEE